MGIFRAFRKLDSERRRHTDKVRYDSLDAALAARERMERKEQAPFNVYRCQVCSSYHLGHRTKRGR